MIARLYDYIPKGEVWFLPEDCVNQKDTETGIDWIHRVLQAAKDGRVGIIKNIQA